VAVVVVEEDGDPPGAAGADVKDPVLGQLGAGSAGDRTNVAALGADRVCCGRTFTLL